MPEPAMAMIDRMFSRDATGRLNENIRCIIPINPRAAANSRVAVVHSASLGYDGYEDDDYEGVGHHYPQDIFWGYYEHDETGDHGSPRIRILEVYRGR